MIDYGEDFDALKFNPKPRVIRGSWHYLGMTLTTLPLFPLTTILFPDGLLPLQIFELRYLNMVKKCIADGTEFGVVAQTVHRNAVAESPATTEASALALPMSQETFTAIGTSAKIISHFVPQPGLIRIDCVGGQRFSIVSTRQQTGGLWVAQVQTIAADLVIPVPAELLEAATALRHLITTLKSQATEASFMPIAKPYLFDDCGWVANRWCELIPMQSAQRHRLLTLDNPLIRLELVQDMLLEQGLLR
jgi:Lon protease-like protein